MGFNDSKNNYGCSSSICNSSDPSTPPKIPRKIRNARPEDVELAFASEPNTIIEDMTMIVAPDSKFIGRRIYVENQKMSGKKNAASFQPKDRFNSVVRFSRNNLRFVPAFVPERTDVKLKNEISQNTQNNYICIPSSFEKVKPNNFEKITSNFDEENKNSDVNSDYELAFNSAEETTDSSHDSVKEDKPKNEFQDKPFGFFRPPPPSYPKKEFSASDKIFGENRSFNKQERPSKQRRRRMNDEKKAAMDKMLSIHHERSRSRN